MYRATGTPIETCRQILSAGKLIPFIGAGFSARFKFPTWSGLLDVIAKELDWDPDVFKLSGNYLQLAEYYVAKKGAIGDLRSKLDKIFHASEAAIEGSFAHEMLVALNFSLIYTTNYEDTIERGFQLFGSKYGKKCLVVANIDNFQEIDGKAVQIVKFHGTFNDDDSLVLTESDYFDRLEFESPLDIKLRSDMLGNSLLFLGYSFSDINLRLMLYKLMKLRKQHKLPDRLPAAIMAGSGFTPIQRELLERWDVVVVELDPVDRNRSMDEFLGNLR
jgi:hypothetical protein